MAFTLHIFRVPILNGVGFSLSYIRVLRYQCKSRPHLKALVERVRLRFSIVPNGLNKINFPQVNKSLLERY